MAPVPLIFGEVLFDCFEDGSRVLGGAPFNVAWNLQAFGAKPLLVSRVGEDAPGREVRDRMQDWGMTCDGLQSDPVHPTGSVRVTFPKGEPAYEIVADRAWDFIDAERVPPGAPSILYHGSLALRSPASAAALETLKARHQAPVFVDVNLRPPWWQPDAVHHMLDQATHAKLNEHEVDRLAETGGDLRERARRLLERHQLDLVIVTRGRHGAFALEPGGDGASVTPAGNAAVVDTVGAGDAFTSVVLLGLLEGWTLATTLERAQTFASALVGVRGATVDHPDFYCPFLATWQP